MTVEGAQETRLDSWVVKSVRLKFVFGGFLLRAVRFKALVLNAYFGHLSTDPSEPRGPIEQQPVEVRATLVSSHPVERRLPRLSFVGDRIRYVPRQYKRFYLDLNGTFEDYIGQLSHNRRKQLRRTLRSFAAASGGCADW